MKCFIFALNSLVAIGIGMNLLLQIQGGKPWSIALACLSLLFILIALFFSHKLWYTIGCTDTLEEEAKRWEELNSRLKEATNGKRNS